MPSIPNNYPRYWTIRHLTEPGLGVFLIEQDASHLYKTLCGFVDHVNYLVESPLVKKDDNYFIAIPRLMRLATTAQESIASSRVNDFGFERNAAIPLRWKETIEDYQRAANWTSFKSWFRSSIQCYDTAENRRLKKAARAVVATVPARYRTQHLQEILSPNYLHPKTTEDKVKP